MENLNGFHPNYLSNYTTCQLSLPMDLSIKIDKSNEVASFSEAMKGMNLRKYFKTVSRGNRGYNKEEKMNTKYDYYNQTGVSRACYNAQIAVSVGIIVNAELYQRPGEIHRLLYRLWMGVRNTQVD